MKKWIYKSLLLIALTLLWVCTLSSCGNSLEQTTEFDTLKAGEKISLAFTYDGEVVAGDDFYYASADQSVVSVSPTGLLTACKAGQTTIYVQHKEDATIKMTFDVTVVYDVVDELNAIKSHRYKDKYEYGTEPMPFFDRNKYEIRGKEDSLLDIVKIVTGTHEDEYVFTELTQLVKTQDDAFVVLADWGNQDVALSADVLHTTDLSAYLVDDLGLSEDKFAQEGESLAQTAIKKTISEQMKDLGYEIARSKMSDEYEYRVSVKIDYRAYRTVNYYSRGLVQGGLNAIKDLFNMNIDKFLDSYTYQKEIHEIVLDDCQLVIERRPKAQ